MASIKRELQTALNFEKRAKMKAKVEIQAHKRAVLRLRKAQKRALALVSKPGRARTRKQKYPGRAAMGKPNYRFGEGYEKGSDIGRRPLLPADSPLAARLRAAELLRIAESQEAIAADPKLHAGLLESYRRNQQRLLRESAEANRQAAKEIIGKVGGIGVGRRKKTRASAPRSPKAPPSPAQLAARAAFAAMVKSKKGAK